MPSFTLRWDNGAILFEDQTEHAPSPAERRNILNFFASPITVFDPTKAPLDAKSVHQDAEVVVQPGSFYHFETAVYQIPVPFGRMPGGAK